MAEAMKPHGVTIEVEKCEEMIKIFNHGKSEEDHLTLGPIYRKLLIIGLDEFELAKNKPRHIQRTGKSFSGTVSFKSEILEEVLKVAKKKSLGKPLAIRYLILIGFNKFKKDMEEYNSNLISDNTKPLDFEHLKTTHKAWQKEEEQQQEPVSKSENIPEVRIDEIEKVENSENEFTGKSIHEYFQNIIDLISKNNLKKEDSQEYFQNIIDLISKSNLKKDSSGSLFDLLKNKKFNFNFSVSIDDI